MIVLNHFKGNMYRNIYKEEVQSLFDAQYNNIEFWCRIPCQPDEICRGKVHSIHSRKLIMTDHDKIYVCLSEHLKEISMKRSWITPLGIFITIIATISTTTFKPIFGVSSGIVFAIFVISGIFVFFWFIWSFYRDLKSKASKILLRISLMT